MPMYAGTGFRAMAPAVSSGTDSVIPICIPLDPPPPELQRQAGLCSSRLQSERSVSLLPGPVEIDPGVTRAFHAPPVSHRSAAFVAAYEETRSQLSALMGG